MDPLSIIGSTLGIIGSIKQAYDLFREIQGLPKAFDAVNQQLPLVSSILRHAETRLRSGPVLSDQEQTAINKALTICENKIRQLDQIFRELAEKFRAISTSLGKTWQKLSETYIRILKTSKAGRVEELMEDILRQLKMLALGETFKAATEVDVKKLEQALEDLTKLVKEQPSVVPGEDASPAHGEQNVRGNGDPSQYNVSGGEFEANKGGLAGKAGGNVENSGTVHNNNRGNIYNGKRDNKREDSN